VTERITQEILNDPQLLSALADKIYQKLRDEAIIKKLEENSASIRALQEAVKSLQETVNRHTEAIVSLQETTKKQGEAIASLQEEVKKMGEAIVGLQKAVLRLSRQVVRLRVEVSSFTNRAGKGIEKTMLRLYRKSLELHGVDPKKVVHAMITDEEGVIEKGKTFEVDFYETNDHVYVFEIKNFADKGTYDQIIVRKKLFSSKYKDKKIEIFVVANYVDKKVKRRLEEEGVEIIASHVVK